MIIRFIGALLCGGLLALTATTDAVAEGKGKKQTKVAQPQAVEFVFIQFAGKKTGKGMKVGPQGDVGLSNARVRYGGGGLAGPRSGGQGQTDSPGRR